MTPTYPLTVNRAEVASLLGTYDFTWGSAAADDKPAQFVLALSGNRLIGTWTPVQPGNLRETQLLPAARDTFMRTSVNNGQIWSLVPGSSFVFNRVNGTVTGFDLHQDAFIDAHAVRRKDP